MGVRCQWCGSITSLRTTENRTPLSVMQKDWVSAPFEHFQVELVPRTMWYEKMGIGAAQPPTAASGLSIERFLS